MALAGDILKEFLIGIAFEINQSSLNKMLGGIKQVDTATQHLDDNTKKHAKETEAGLAKQGDHFKKLGATIADALGNKATAALASLTKTVAAAGAALYSLHAIAEGFERIEGIRKFAKSVGATAQDVHVLTRAMGDDAQSAMQAISSALLKNPQGMRAFLQQSLGVSETKPSLKMMEELSAGLFKIREQYGDGVALLYAQEAGLSEEHYRKLVINREGFVKGVASQRKIVELWSYDADKAGAATKRVTDAQKLIASHTKTFTDHLAAIKAQLQAPFYEALVRGLEYIAPQVGRALKATSDTIEAWSKDLEIWYEKESEDPNSWLTSFKNALKGMDAGMAAEGDRIIAAFEGMIAGLKIDAKDFQGVFDTMKEGALLALTAVTDAFKKAQAVVTKAPPAMEGGAAPGVVPGMTLNGLRGGYPPELGPWPDEALRPKGGFKLKPHVDPSSLMPLDAESSQFGATAKTQDAVAPRTVAPKPLVPTPPPVPSYLAPSLSGYEGTTPGDHDFSDMGQGRAATPEEIEAAKKQDGAATKQEKAAETFAKAVEDDRKARQEGGGGGIAGMVQRGLDWLKGLLPGGGGDGMPGGWIDKGGFEGNAAGGGGAGGAGGEGGPTGYTSGGRGALGALKGKAGERFAEVAPRLMDRLMKEKGLTRAQAAGIVGNLAHESASFTQSQEQNPRGGQGGLGYAQWTGPRRVAFENWAKSKGLDPTSDKASEEYLLNGDPEFAGAVAAVKKTDTVDAASRTFEQNFEKAAADAKHYDRRLEYARRAFTGGAGPVSAEASGTGFDNPAAAGQTVIRTGSGARVTVGRQYAENFKGFLKDYEAAGGKIDPGHTSGYVNRNIAGTNTKSYHGMDGGRAIDINMSGRNVISSGLPGGIAQEEALAKKWGLRPGSSFRNPDRGHFEVHDQEAARQALIRNASRLGSGDRQTGAPADGRTGAGTPLSSGPVANDNSRTISQVNNFNTKVHASDPKAAASVFKRSNEQLSGMATAQLKSNMR
jgi:hypothetical protein